MRSKFLGYVIALTVTFAVSAVASADPKNHGKAAAEAGDKNMDKQMEWEKKVMGSDNAKAADMRKIANAQKLADEAAKHPAPVQAPKPKDPNKEGVKAKQEAAIGLPIAEEETRTVKKHGNSKKAAETSSTDDALGALVASSLAEEKAPAGRTKAASGSAKTKGHAKAPASSLDQMFANSKE